ncbi:MAG: ABC transporter ATP-binding protein [Bilophila wadsworthia]
MAYLGPNGAGKTTTVRILSGQARADGGTVKLAGRNLTEHPLEAKALCGVVSQHLNLDAELSVRENLDIHGRLFGMNASERKEGITSLLETVEMVHKVDVLTKTLSGGEKRRIMLARALLHKPRILFLDEPTVGRPLIPNSGAIKRIQQEGTTILLTTHYIEEAEFLADRVIFLDKGRIVAEGTPNALMNRIGQWALDVQCNGLLTTRYFNERDEAARETTQEQGTSTVRRVNLEDVFLSITGRKVSGSAQ